LREGNVRITLTISAVAIGYAMTLVSADAREYAYCRLPNSDCSYSTLAQCQAAASGTFGDCQRNPHYRGPRYVKRKVYY
jgi:hypothetical protein